MAEHNLGSGEQLIADLQEWALEHAENSGGQLGLLPYDPEHYPGQDSVSVIGDPQSAAVVDSVAAVAQPRYGEIAKLLDSQEASTQEVSRIGELLRGGNNVMLATNHGDLIDIAISHAAFYSLLDRRGYEMKTGIVISKMVAFLAYRLGAELAPAVEVLKILEDEQFLSYPRTETARKRGVGRLLPSEVDRHNKHMRERIDHKLGEGSLLLAVSASGTVDKPAVDDPDTIVMSGIGTGTYKLMNTKGTYVVPVAVWYGSQTAVFETCDIPRIIKDEDMAKGVMQRIARRLTERVEDKKFVYKA